MVVPSAGLTYKQIKQHFLRLSKKFRPNRKFYFCTEKIKNLYTCTLNKNGQTTC